MVSTAVFSNSKLLKNDRRCSSLYPSAITTKSRDECAAHLFHDADGPDATNEQAEPLLPASDILIVTYRKR
jgi:hypothetical protein